MNKWCVVLYFNVLAAFAQPPSAGGPPNGAVDAGSGSGFGLEGSGGQRPPDGQRPPPNQGPQVPNPGAPPNGIGGAPFDLFNGQLSLGGGVQSPFAGLGGTQQGGVDIGSGNGGPPFPSRPIPGQPPSTGFGQPPGGLGQGPFEGGPGQPQQPQFPSQNGQGSLFPQQPPQGGDGGPPIRPGQQGNFIQPSLGPQQPSPFGQNGGGPNQLGPRPPPNFGQPNGGNGDGSNVGQGGLQFPGNQGGGPPFPNQLGPQQGQDSANNSADGTRGLQATVLARNSKE